MKANNKNAAKARTSAKANPSTPNSTANLAQKSAKIISAEQNYLQSKAKLYMLKCFVELDCFTRFITKCSYNYDEIAEFLGFYHLCDSKETYQADRKLIKAKVLDFCENALCTLQKSQKQGKFGRHKVLEENLSLLQETLHLNSVEFALLELIVIVEEVPAFKDFLETYEKIGRREVALVISQILGCSCKDMLVAMHNDSILMKMQIISSRNHSLETALSFNDSDFIDILLSEYGDKNALTRNFATPCGKTTLTKDDYAYIKELDLLLSYLKQALMRKKSGVNILLYGAPGTGKTEFAKLLAQNVNAKLHKVKTSDEDGDATDGVHRLNSYLLAQKFLEPSENILLYDEVEDILNSSIHEKRLKHKAFLNESLENNAVATIWISNDIYRVDRAIIRRFDFVLEAKVPKDEIREQILHKICGDKLDEKAYKFAKKARNLAPAVIKRAYDISSVVEGDFSANFTTLIKNTLKAQEGRHLQWGKKKKTKAQKIELPQSYSAEFINAGVDVEALASGIVVNANARICLYGLSGTGKSAYARYIAQKLERPCIVKSASDLKSCWLGESEKNIAKAFKEAKKKKAVLVFDEVDSFLRDRNGAVRSWEVSEVNEMLVQMEKFDGIFIATTNLMDGLDKAALRRFDLKLEFKALNEEQRVRLFERECELLHLPCEADTKAQIARLECLTPGDFAAVKRQHKFTPLKSAEDFYERLCEEVRVKDLKRENAKAGFFG